MYIVDIGFSHGAEPLFTWRGAYTHIVSIGSAACQEPLGTMLGATRDNVRSNSAACPQGLETMAGNIPRKKARVKILYIRLNISLLDFIASDGSDLYMQTFV